MPWGSTKIKTNEIESFEVSVIGLANNDSFMFHSMDIGLNESKNYATLAKHHLKCQNGIMLQNFE